MSPRLKELFYKEIQPSLKSQFGFKNLYMGPKIEKVVFLYNKVLLILESLFFSLSFFIFIFFSN